MRNIVEFLLSKNNAKINDKKAKQELIDKIYDKFKGYGEFERIKTDGTFYATVETEDELRLYWAPEIVKLANVEKQKQGNGEIIATWKIDDIIEFFNYNYDRVFSQINDWFDYL